MWGAIIGDLAGSIYEFEQYKKVSNITIKELITKNSFFSDDTILTIAVLDASLNDKNYEKYLKSYAIEYMNYKPNTSQYFEHTFSLGFEKWVKGEKLGNSTGNGAMMRVSPIGFLLDDEEKIIEEAIKVTSTSHNSKEANESAITIALIIFYARKGYNKEWIINKLNLKIHYCKFEKFNTTCSETIDNCLYALFSSNNFEESLKKVISYGGDTDTNACIVGSMAEAMYGINNNLIETASKKIPKSFVKKLKTAYSKMTF